MAELAELMTMLVIPDNPPEWPQYAPEVVAAARFNPKTGHQVNVRRLFETIDADRWYLVLNVYSHRSRADRGGRMEMYETVHGIPRPRRGARGYVALKQQSQTDRLWHKGITYEYQSESAEGLPIGEPVAISIEDAYRYWEEIRIKLRLSERDMEHRGMPKPRRHVINGKPWWWGSGATQPDRTVAERVRSFRRIAGAAR